MGEHRRLKKKVDQKRPETERKQENSGIFYNQECWLACYG